MSRPVSVDQWEALADALGEVETARLFGPHPGRLNTADAVERLYFSEKAPRRAVWVAAVLGLVMASSVAWGATHHRAQAPVSTDIGCALVLTQSGSECRP